jgi:uncharacterized protein
LFPRSDWCDGEEYYGEARDMQQVSVITLGIADLARSRHFYVDGFGWTPVFENEEIVFYQMNGFVLGTWMKDKLNEDMRDAGRSGTSSFALAHNVDDEAAVRAIIDRLVAAGGTLMRPADAPPMAAIGAMWLIPMGMPGRLRGTRPGQSMNGAW